MRVSVPIFPLARNPDAFVQNVEFRLPRDLLEECLRAPTIVDMDLCCKEMFRQEAESMKFRQ